MGFFSHLSMRSMDILLNTLVFSCVVFHIIASSLAQDSCGKYSFTSNKKFTTCVNLPVQNAFLHWTYNPTSHTADIAFRHGGVSASQWIAWALNLDKPGMIGAQSLVAFKNSSGAMRAYTSPIKSYKTTLSKEPLSFNVSKITAEFLSSKKEMIIFASFKLPSGRTSFNQVWQEGPVSDGALRMHGRNSANLIAVGPIDFSTGKTSNGGGVGGSNKHKRNIHGVLNTVAWGILLPLGIMSARFLKNFADPAWFYLHLLCQCSGYVIGVAGWGTGLKLGNDSPGIVHHKHRNIGITLFVLGTLQVFALLLRPNKDHSHRFYWNIYHHSVGYIIIILSIINIFEGLDILDPAKKWKRAYIGIMVTLLCIAAILEAFTWFFVLKRKNNDSQEAA